VAGAFDQYRLPPGRHGLREVHVRESQRWRLLGACAEIIATSGYWSLSLRVLTKEAAVSKGTFYKNFESLGDCVLATHVMAAESALGATLQSCDDDSDTTTPVESAVRVALELLEREPGLAGVLIDAALLDVPGVYHARAEFVEDLAALLSTYGHATPAPSPVPALRLALHRVRAVFGLLASRLPGEPFDLPPSAAAELSHLLQG
jgi:AcrR family transcriptional regulator